MSAKLLERRSEEKTAFESYESWEYGSKKNHRADKQRKAPKLNCFLGFDKQKSRFALGNLGRAPQFPVVCPVGLQLAGRPSRYWREATETTVATVRAACERPFCRRGIRCFSLVYRATARRRATALHLN